jgi:hypothetical protein
MAEFTLQAGEIKDPLCRVTLEITVPGRPIVMLVPIMFLNGNVTGVQMSQEWR